MWGLFEEKGWGGLAGMEGEDRWYLGLLGHDSKIVLGLVSVFNLFTVFVFDLPKRIFGWMLIARIVFCRLVSSRS